MQNRQQVWPDAEQKKCSSILGVPSETTPSIGGFLKPHAPLNSVESEIERGWMCMVPSCSSLPGKLKVGSHSYWLGTCPTCPTASTAPAKPDQHLRNKYLHAMEDKIAKSANWQHLFQPPQTRGRVDYYRVRPPPQLFQQNRCFNSKIYCSAMQDCTWFWKP